MVKSIAVQGLGTTSLYHVILKLDFKRILVSQGLLNFNYLHDMARLSTRVDFLFQKLFGRSYNKIFYTAGIRYVENYLVF